MTKALILAAGLAVTPLPAFAQGAPPLGWDIGNSFAKDVCTERDDLANDAACYAAQLRTERAENICRDYPGSVICENVFADNLATRREMRQLVRYAARHMPGYPPGDMRCTLTYQRRTGGEFLADDAPNCRRTTTLEDVCIAGATEFTDERNLPLRCPEEPIP